MILEKEELQEGVGRVTLSPGGSNEQYSHGQLPVNAPASEAFGTNQGHATPLPRPGWPQSPGRSAGQMGAARVAWRIQTGGRGRGWEGSNALSFRRSL